MKKFLVIAVGSVMVSIANAQVATYLFDQPCITSCTTPGPDCPGVGTPLPSSINNAVLSAASSFNVSPALGLGTYNCSVPAFAISMNGFASGNPGNPSRARWAQGWTIAVAANMSHYYSAVLATAMFANVALTQITLDESRSASGPRMCQIMVSVDGGPFTLLWQQTIPDNTAWRNRSITSLTALAPMPSFNNTLEIRFYGFASENSAGPTWRIDNVRFYADVANLPIELVSFTGRVVEEDVELTWSTASETDNDYFTLLRSGDTEEWQEVGHVDGAGESQVPVRYEFLDEHPVLGANYYKLRQTDYDGTFKDSDAITVVWQPFDPSTADVFDVSGAFIRTWSGSLEGLPSGMYLVRDKRGTAKKFFAPP